MIFQSKKNVSANAKYVKAEKIIVQILNPNGIPIMMLRKIFL